MKVNPINKNNSNFRAAIKPSESLKRTFEVAEKYTEKGTMKEMNSVKEFLDDLSRISESQKISKYKIDIDKSRPEYTYTKINGKRISGGANERQQSLQDSYLVMRSTNRFASHLEEAKPTFLDNLKSQIEETQEVLESLKERYRNRLKAELEQAQKLIFKDV